MGRRDQEQVWRNMLARLSDSPVVRTGPPRSALGTGQQGVWPQITSLSHLSSESILRENTLTGTSHPQGQASRNKEKKRK